MVSFELKIQFEEFIFNIRKSDGRIEQAEHEAMAIVKDCKKMGIQGKELFFRDIQQLLDFRESKW